MGRNPVCYNYRATLISYRSCLKPVDTFRPVGVLLFVPFPPRVAAQAATLGYRILSIPAYTNSNHCETVSPAGNQQRSPTA